jgi:hypothetical protein
MVNEAEIKALNRLKNQNLHLGNFLAEADKTIKMVESGAKSIALQVTNYRKRYPFQWLLVKRWQTGGLAKKFWRCIPDSWLQLQYGWIPLMSDIMGALEELNKSSPGDLLFSVVGKSKSEDSDLRKLFGMETSSYCILRTKIHEKCKVKLWYKLNNPTLAELSSLGLINPAEIVWEVMRYSFVVDWFLPVGSWLSALTADLGYSFKGGSRGQHLLISDEVIGEHWEPPGDGTIQTFVDGDPFSVKGAWKLFERHCYDRSPVPGVYVKNPLSARHVANAIALLAQAFR